MARREFEARPGILTRDAYAFALLRAGQPEAAARLAGAADAVLSSLAVLIYPRDQPVRARVLAELQAAFGEERLATALEEGCRLSIDQAVAEAMAVAAAVAPLS